VGVVMTFMPLGVIAAPLNGTSYSVT
jgi:hypothetical protein